MSLPVFTLKNYQLQALAALRMFLEKTVELSDADTAFYAVTKRPFTCPKTQETPMNRCRTGHGPGC